MSTTEHTGPRTAILVRRSLESCKCHGPTWVVACPKCGSDRAYRFRSRPGRDRTWHRDTSGWTCSDCGARGQTFELVAAA